MVKNDYKLIEITSEFITLGQFLKFSDVINNGGEAKEFIFNHKIVIDGIENKQRGKKLYPGTKIEIDDKLFFEIKK